MPTDLVYPVQSFVKAIHETTGKKQKLILNLAHVRRSTGFNFGSHLVQNLCVWYDSIFTWSPIYWLYRWQHTFIGQRKYSMSDLSFKINRWHCKKMKFSTKDFSNKCDQIRRKLRIWSHLLEKYLTKNFIFCAVWELFNLIAW